MTCTAALIHGGRVWMASDSAWASSEEIVRCAEAKIAQMGPMLVGVAGHSSPWRALLRRPPQSLDDLADAAHVSDETSIDLLVGLAGKIYYVTEGQVVQAADGYAAIGSGGAYALGALYADRRANPEGRIKRAIEAAARHCPTVCPPVVVRSVG